MSENKVVVLLVICLTVSAVAEQTQLQKFRDYIAQHWLLEGPEDYYSEGWQVEGDLTGDNHCNFADFSIFSADSMDDYCYNCITTIEYRDDTHCDVLCKDCLGVKIRYMNYSCCNGCTGWTTYCAASAKSMLYTTYFRDCSGSCSLDGDSECTKVSCEIGSPYETGTPSLLPTKCKCYNFFGGWDGE